jgi:hypothetical protein
MEVRTYNGNRRDIDPATLMGNVFEAPGDDRPLFIIDEVDLPRTTVTKRRVILGEGTYKPSNRPLLFTSLQSQYKFVAPSADSPEYKEYLAKRVQEATAEPCTNGTEDFRSEFAGKLGKVSTSALKSMSQSLTTVINRGFEGITAVVSKGFSELSRAQQLRDEAQQRRDVAQQRRDEVQQNQIKQILEAMQGHNKMIVDTVRPLTELLWEVMAALDPKTRRSLVSRCDIKKLLKAVQDAVNGIQNEVSELTPQECNGCWAKVDPYTTE